MISIQTSGIDLMKDNEKNLFDKIINSELEKINKKFRNISSFYLHFKEHKKEGAKPKYSLHSKISINVFHIETTSSGWDLREVLKELFRKIDNEIEHKLKIKK
ncbi:MAG: hypothetical protein AABW83_02730 [Nanoarchaeota archaeon]